MVLARITNDPIRTEEVLRTLATSADGAMVLFVGVVRDRNEGRQVSGLEYEAYEEMANRVLSEIGREAEERFGTDRIWISHRVGRLDVGEVSAVIGVASPHRAEAFGASRYIIEEIKARVPVWKRENYLQGESRWVGGSSRSPTQAGEAGERGSGGAGWTTDGEEGGERDDAE